MKTDQKFPVPNGELSSYVSLNSKTANVCLTIIEHSSMSQLINNTPDDHSASPCSFGDRFSIWKFSTWFRSTRLYPTEKPALVSSGHAVVETEERHVEFEQLPRKFQQAFKQLPQFLPRIKSEGATERTTTLYGHFDAYKGELVGRNPQQPNAGTVQRIGQKWEEVSRDHAYALASAGVSLSETDENKSVTNRIIRSPNNDNNCFQPGTPTPVDHPPRTQPASDSPAARRVYELSHRLGLPDTLSVNGPPGHDQTSGRAIGL